MVNVFLFLTGLVFTAVVIRLSWTISEKREILKQAGCLSRLVYSLARCGFSPERIFEFRHPQIGDVYFVKIIEVKESYKVFRPDGRGGFSDFPAIEIPLFLGISTPKLIYDEGRSELFGELEISASRRDQATKSLRYYFLCQFEAGE